MVPVTTAVKRVTVPKTAPRRRSSSAATVKARAIPPESAPSLRTWPKCSAATAMSLATRVEDAPSLETVSSCTNDMALGWYPKLIFVQTAVSNAPTAARWATPRSDAPNPQRTLTMRWMPVALLWQTLEEMAWALLEFPSPLPPNGRPPPLTLAPVPHPGRGSAFTRVTTNSSDSFICFVGKRYLIFAGHVANSP
jgi:hypothetical protein